MVALLFPGQGSQFVGMGRELATAFPAARAAFQEADDVLGVPLSRLCWEGPEQELTATMNAQPAIMTHSIAVHRVIAAELGDVRFAAGHSLGEFSAYVAAGSVSFADGVRTVRVRGELMYRGGQARPGTMAALLGLDDGAAEQLCAEASAQGGQCVVANYNSPGQIVISGDEKTVHLAVDNARKSGAKRAVLLNVSGAFHSPLMRIAQDGLQKQLATIEVVAPRFPVVSNVTAQPVAEAGEALRLLVEQLTSPVRWTDTVRTMIGAGVDRFLELGPGSVLTGLLKRIDRNAASAAVGGPADLTVLAAG